MALSPKDRGPRLTVPCVRCGGPARLKSIEFVMFRNGSHEAIYECDCGGVITRALPKENSPRREIPDLGRAHERSM